MNLIKPKKLEIGDTIEFVAPSGPVENEEIALKAKKYFEQKGYKVVFAEHLFDKKRYLAGADEARLEDLHNAFKDTSVDAIICLRGGYGAIRLIEKIDYDLVRKNSKIFAGYSDITALSAIFLKRAGLITYSAPMINGDFGNDELKEYTENSFFNTLTKSETQKIEAKKVYKSGICDGITFGGNLSTVVSLCGLDFLPDEKFIFFAEDVCEPSYKIDKMFTQLLNIKEFKNKLAGIVLGEFIKTDNEEWLEDYFTELSQELDIPFIGGFKITHAKEKLTIPYGIKSAVFNNLFILN